MKERCPVGAACRDRQSEHRVHGAIVRGDKQCSRCRVATRRCFRVLIEERLDGPRLRTIEVFGMVSKGSARFQRTLAHIIREG